MFVKHKYKIIAGVVIAAALVIAFFYGGGAPGLQDQPTVSGGSSAQTAAGQPAAGASTNPNAPVASNREQQDGNSVSPAGSGENDAVIDIKTPEYEARPDYNSAGEQRPDLEDVTDGISTGESTEQSGTPATNEPPGPSGNHESTNPSSATEQPERPGLSETPASSGASESSESDQDGPLTGDDKAGYNGDAAAGTSDGAEPDDSGNSQPQGIEIDPATGTDKYLTSQVPNGRPAPVEPQDAEITDESFTVWLSVRCDTILNNMEWLDNEKWELVPANGEIFAMTSVIAYKGESVFNVLQREMRRARIHMEFRNTPIYNSAFIQGINNLYEFDVGELSGWVYKVNDWFPNYGCSRYLLQPGDVIEWLYSCNLGADVGGYNVIGG